MTLGKLLKAQGRSQKWLAARLLERGISRAPTSISQMCRNKRKPKDEYVYIQIAIILAVPIEEIRMCFSEKPHLNK